MSQREEKSGITASTAVSNTFSFWAVSCMNISLHHRISPVVTSNTSMGSGAYSILLERAESMPPETRSMYWRTDACAIFVRRRPTRMTRIATKPSAAASSGSKGTVTATKTTRHRLYSVILVRNPWMIFLLK